MASNYTNQSSVGEPIEIAPQILPDLLMQQEHDGVGHSMDTGRGAPVSGYQTDTIHSSMRSCTMTTNSSYRKFNDVKLIRDRQIGFNQRARRQMELLCEDRISKHKLEEIHCSLPSSIKSTFIMTFSPDGRRVASTHGDHRIYICDLNTGKLLDTLDGHPKTPWCLAWHPSNGDILASGCLSGEVRVWDLKSKACESWTSDNHTIITSLDFHPKERVLVIATANDILFWDWGESEPFAKTTTMDTREKVKFVVFDSSGTKLITGISNLPKYAGYDSLQNRIIDGYLSQGAMEPLPTENMTQSSETTTSPVTGTNNLNENFNGRDANLSFASRRTDSSVNNSSINNDGANEQDANYRNTLSLSRVAYLYRQLESLEDSMRHTGFAPLLSLRSTGGLVSSSESSSDDNSNLEVSQRPSNQRAGTTPKSAPDQQQHQSQRQQTSDTNDCNKSGKPPTQNSPSQNRPDSSENPQTSSTYPISSTFDPYIVTFDESLEQIQLTNLIMDGRPVDLATVIDQYPVDLSRHLYHAMQFDSVNQVNQSFIRISKLLSSARLYRQVVQQIMSTSSGDGPHQPNQILTAQSISQRSPRNSPNVPIVLRNFPIETTPEPNGLLRSVRAHDPIMAIEFRNTARNVPLTSICKIDLLAARTMCIQRAQHHVERAIENSIPLINQSSGASQPVSTAESEGSTADRPFPNPPLELMLVQLHSTLITINHAPLTTSNAYSHITSLRVILEKLHKMLAKTLRSTTDGRRLSDLMHNIAFSLTNRRWTMPLGGTLDDIRLDVIHTLCIADLTLHFLRQVQLLQMQRISIITRVDESRRQAAATSLANLTSARGSMDLPTGKPSTSTETTTRGMSKRKSRPEPNDLKRRRVEGSAAAVSDTDAVASQLSEIRASSVGDPSSNMNQQVNSSPMEVTPDPSTGLDRMVIWNNLHNPIEQSLQRFFVAAPTNLNNSHILVRVFHRLHGMPNQHSHIQPGTILEPSSLERIAPHIESRRRALSQDNSVNSPDSMDTTGSVAASAAAVASAEVPTARSRIRPPAAFHVNLIPQGPNHHPASSGLAFDAWQRHPHLHVYQTRGVGQHLWFNQWTIPLPMNNSNYRIQCWSYSRDSVPSIKDSQMDVVTHRCRIHNNSSIDLSSNGSLIACLVPRDDGPACFPSIDLKIFSLRTYDFGTCYYKLPQGPNALSVSFSPSGTYAVVGLATHKSMSYEHTDDDITIGKVYKLQACNNSSQLVRDIKIKRDDSSVCLNAIRWMPRGIVYSVGPQHIQRYPTARMRNVVAS